MNADIKAIETAYKGYRFRSRLEARWAIFFDHLRIPWEYELQGFELPCGKRYLPDFYLPSLAVWVEVKPTRHFSTEDLEKIAWFSEEKQLLLIAGSPGTSDLFLVRGVLEWGTGATANDAVLPYGNSAACLHNIGTEFLVRFCPKALSGPGNGDQGEGEWTLVFVAPPYSEQWLLDEAITKARSARFEHGEKGAKP